jgi:hypothetical protein
MVSGHTVTIDVGSLSTYGLSVSNNTITSGGSVTLTYNGTTAVTNTTPSLALTISGGNNYYTLSGSSTVSVTIADGGAAGARAIPVTQENFVRATTGFNAYARTTGYNKHYKLIEDITPATGNWIMIAGANQSVFSGSFDGQYHTITNLDGMMFGQVTGTVKNLGLVNVSANNSLAMSSNYNYIGGVVGYLNGTVENCFVTGSVWISMISSRYGVVGGVVGYLAGNAIVRNCYSNAYVEVSADSSISISGGVVGRASINNSNSVENCYSTGKVTSTSAVSGVGGIAVRCVALNSSITSNISGASISRVADSVTSSYGKTGITMTRNGVTYTPTSNLNGQDGLDTTTWNTSAFWSSTVGWDMTNIWQWSSSLTRPVLRGFATQP